MEGSSNMKRNAILIFVTFAFFCLISFMSFAENVEVVPVLSGMDFDDYDEDDDDEDPVIPILDDEEEEETYTMPQTTAIYTSENDPLFIVEVDGEGNTKHIHLPYPDATINYDKVDYKKAKYSVLDDEVIIKYGKDTYVVSSKDESGFYTTVNENGREYSIDRYQKIAGIDNYLYKGKEYEVDDEGYIVAYRREWVESDYRDYDGEKIGNYEDTKLLFRKEVPFNILWKHRPLSDEERELLYTGPGVGIKSISHGTNEDGTIKIVSKRKPEEASVEDTGVGYAKNKVTVIDPMNPMQAKSVRKKKND